MKRIKCIDAISTATMNLNEEEAFYVSNILRGFWKYSKTKEAKELYSIQIYMNKLVDHVEYKLTESLKVEEC
jgi:hypothetical protein